MPVSDAMHQGDLVRRIEKLERLVRELSSARGLESSSIGEGGLRLIEGGALTVDGGNIIVRNPSGVNVARFGDIQVGQDITRGWIFRFDTGNLAFALGGRTGGQYWALYDSQGRQIVANDAQSRHGLSRPYIPLRLVPAFSAQQEGASMWPSTDASTPTKLLQGVNSLWHPKISIGVAITGSGSGTGHWRLDINGRTVIADETTGGVRTVSIPDWGDDIKPGDAVGIDVYGWVTGGGRVYLQCDRIYGRQS